MISSDHKGRQQRAEAQFSELTRLTRSFALQVKDKFPSHLATTLAIETEAFRRAADSMGLISCSESRAKLLDSEPDWIGSEHRVWRERLSQVLKVTYGGVYGHLPWKQNASPLQYLQRLKLCNLVFDDCIELAGVISEEVAPAPVVLTTQPFVEGEELPEVEIASHMEARGFERRKAGRLNLPVWCKKSQSSSRTLFIGDLHSKNVLRTPEGKVVVIDGIVALKSTESRR